MVLVTTSEINVGNQSPHVSQIRNVCELCGFLFNHTKRKIASELEYFGKEEREQIYPLFSHPQPHFRQAVGQRAAAVGSLICSVGLTQAIALRSFAGSPPKEGLQPRR